MKFPNLLFQILFLLAVQPIFCRPILEDLSKAACDGPHVFYREGKISVKSIVFQDSAFRTAEKIFTEKNQVGKLSCQLPNNEQFSFQLKKELKNEPTRYDAPEKMLVVSDIEGNFEGFRILLVGAKVIDEKFHWTFGKGHLVLVGDFFDRGLNVTETLWLVYKLENEAEIAGGKVHFILGNHEIMNLSDDHRYVRNKYFENAKLMNEPYEKWFAADTELGRWLRTKNAIELIGTTIFCHGGISEEVAATGLSLEKVNEIAREHLGEPFEYISETRARKIFDPATGIFWFRGIAKKKVEEEAVTRALRWAGAQKMVIGHTVMPEVVAIYSNRVFCVDLFHEENLRLGFMQTLWVENGEFSVINHKGERGVAFNVSFAKP